jgi:hypothetical protein
LTEELDLHLVDDEEEAHFCGCWPRR